VGGCAKGKCTTYFEDGRLSYEGPKNRTARFATKEIKGRKFAMEGPGGKPSWSVPASEYEAFKLLIFSHYPNTDLEELEKHLVAAKKYKGSKKDDSSDYVVESTSGGVLLVKTPFNQDFIFEVKRKCRGKWSQAFKVWEVDDEYLSTLKTVIADAYNKPKVVFK